MKEGNVLLTEASIWKLMESVNPSAALHKIMVTLDGHDIATLTFPVKSEKDMKDLNIFCHNLGNTFKRFVNRLKERYEAKGKIRT